MIRSAMARTEGPITLAALKARQALALGWAGRTPLATPRDAERFLERYGVALRYGTVPSVPLASLRNAAGPANNEAALERSIILTNHLLASAAGIEVNVVAGRLALVRRSLMPALYRLVRRGRPPTDQAGLSLPARTALTLLGEEREVSASDVRHRLGVPARPRADPAYEALAELQRGLLVDRGPFDVPKAGIPYLPREGYPYHLFHKVHGELVREANRLTVTAAADQWIDAYVREAAFGAPRTLASLFRLFLTPDEIAATLARLVAAGRLVAIPVGRGHVFGPADAPSPAPRGSGSEAG